MSPKKTSMFPDPVRQAALTLANAFGYTFADALHPIVPTVNYVVAHLPSCMFFFPEGT